MIAPKSQNTRFLYCYYDLSVSLLSFLASLHSIKEYPITPIVYLKL